MTKSLSAEQERQVKARLTGYVWATANNGPTMEHEDECLFNPETRNSFMKGVLLGVQKYLEANRRQRERLY